MRFSNYVIGVCSLALFTQVQLVAAPYGPEDKQKTSPGEPRTIRARVQPRPGAEIQDIDMEIRPVPTEPPSVAAGQAELGDDELVLGIVIDGQAMAYPIRYLAMYEIVDDQLGDEPVAPTW